MRTQEEIEARYKKALGDVLPFRSEALLPFLELARLRRIHPEAKDWKLDEPTLTDDAVKACMRDYAAFGWDKVIDHRGISASRTVEKMGEWLWLLGDDQMVKTCNDSRLYAPYGAPILKAICQRYGFPVPHGERVGRMGEGLPCHADCEEGCRAA